MEHLYHDATRTLSERSLRLILDVISLVADELYEIALCQISSAPHPDQITARLDDLYASITDVKITGNKTKEEKKIENFIESSSGDVAIRLSWRMLLSLARLRRTKRPGRATRLGRF